MANIIKTTLEDANDVLTYNNRASFPSSGESGKLYIAADTKYTYFWNGSSYVETRGSGYASSSHTHSYISTLASINGYNTSTYPWRRIMSIPSTTDDWKDVIGTYYLSGNYNYGPYYLFRVEFRTNDSSNGKSGSFNIKIIATNANQNNLAIASYSVATKGITTNYSDIFVKVDAYPRMTLTKLSAPDLGTIIYYDSNEGWDASSRTEAYTGINGSDTGYASYKLHSLSEYTYVSYGELSASVKYASIAGSANYVPWKNITDRPTSLKNPKALTFGSKTYDGSSAVELTASDLGINTPEITATTSGNGNAVTGISATGHALTITKGSTFLTSHQAMKYRPIKVNGTQILANNSSTALNLKAGSNVSISNSSGTVTIATSNVWGTINCNNTYPTGYLISNSIAFDPALSVIKLTNFPDGDGGTGTVYLSQPFMSTGGSNSGNLFFTAYTISYRYRFVFQDASGKLTQLRLIAVENNFGN